MAVSLTTVFLSNDLRVTDVIATADADTTATIPHGFGPGVPVDVSISPMNQAVSALSLWALETLSGTTVVLTKATTASSGDAAAQLRVVIRRLGR